MSPTVALPSCSMGAASTRGAGGSIPALATPNTTRERTASQRNRRQSTATIDAPLRSQTGAQGGMTGPPREAAATSVCCHRHAGAAARRAPHGMEGLYHGAGHPHAGRLSIVWPLVSVDQLPDG